MTPNGLLKIPIIEALGTEVLEIQARQREDRHWVASYVHDREEQALRSARYTADQERLDKIRRFLDRAIYTGPNGWGLTSDAYLKMMGEQDCRCAVCRLELGPDLLPVVDHNHATGEIRGLLCGSCNTALGLLKDSPAVVRGALAYLEERGHYGPSEAE